MINKGIMSAPRIVQQIVQQVVPRVVQSFQDFIENEQGQGTVEYILILSVVVAGVAQLRRQIVTALDKGILRIGGAIEKDLKTGRAPLSVWKN